MHTLQINLEGDALTTALQQAIIGNISPELQAEIMREAVKFLTKKQKGRWDEAEKKSPLQVLIDRQIEIAAEKIAFKLIAEDTELMQTVEKLVFDAVLNIKGMQRGGEEWSRLTQRMADSLVKAFSD